MNYIMAACTFNTKQSEEELDNGIICGHAYTVLSAVNLRTTRGMVRLIQLRNPWGGSEWKGDWSDNSRLWTPELKQQVGLKATEDGVFYMTE
jgi:calpain-15